ncbi:MAG: agmatine deiminase family protein [Polyangiaceae bacterium]|nr:agmatine deiminase family protein [Polyangiaceae bacterium]
MARKQKTGRPAPSAGTPHALGFRMPAEWETHAATWLAWPHNRTDWPGKGLLVQWVFVEMAKHLQWGERVRLIVRDSAEQKRALKALLDGGVEPTRVDVFVHETNRSWTRDSLPTFVVRTHRRQGESPRQHVVEREVAAVKWHFNGWARYPDWELDDKTGEAVARRHASQVFLPATGMEKKKKKKQRRVVLEGGAIDVDGQGTLLATEQCLLSGPFPRNAELGKDGMERVLYEQLGVSKVLWLADGIAGDDTSGHIDDFARFVAPGVVLLAQETNPRDDNHRPLESARERLQGARDAKGRKLEVIPMPMPSPVYFAGQRLPASYANFYVGNRVVLVPTFNDPKDRHALGVLAELFPRRTVVGIHCLDLVLGLGTLHCSTQQEPLAGPRR